MNPTLTLTPYAIEIIGLAGPESYKPWTDRIPRGRLAGIYFSNILLSYFKTSIIWSVMNSQCKKSSDFTVKYPATSCQIISRYFYGRLLVNHFRNQEMVGLC